MYLADQPATLRRPKPVRRCCWYCLAIVVGVDVSIACCPMVRVKGRDGYGMSGQCVCIGLLYVLCVFVNSVHSASAQWFAWAIAKQGVGV